MFRQGKKEVARFLEEVCMYIAQNYVGWKFNLQSRHIIQLSNWLRMYV